MAFGSEQWMYSAGGGFYPHEIDQSLRFDTNAYLSRTPSSAGNRKTWTWSGWVKRGDLGSTEALFGAYTDSNNRLYLHFGGGSNTLKLYGKVGGAVSVNFESAALFRDASSWYHVALVMDTTQATASNRAKLYVNGLQQTITFSTTPSLNSEPYINTTAPHRIGDLDGTVFFNGYLAEVNFVDGQALDPTDFGEFKSGVWVPKRYAGTYGTNGFYLKFEGIEGINDLVTNGDFVAATGLSDWTVSGATTPTLQADGLKMAAGATDGRIVQYVTTEVGKSYTVEMNVVTQSGGGTRMEVNDSIVFDTANVGQNAAAQGVWRATFTATTTSTKFELYQAYGGFCVLGWAKMYNNVTVDSSGNDNDWQTNNIYDTDVMLDSPTNNFATFNPLAAPNSSSNRTFSEGNLRMQNDASAYACAHATIPIPKTGKWVFEVLFQRTPTGASPYTYNDVGLTTDQHFSSYFQNGTSTYGIDDHGGTGNQVFIQAGTEQGSHAGLPAGTVVQVFVDRDNNQLTFSINGTLQTQAGSTVTIPADVDLYAINGTYHNITYGNFGQDSSFAGTKTRQGNTDANDIGDFYYAPPADYLALCSANLPDPAIDPAEDDIPADYFNTVLYTGGNNVQSIPVGFQPDLVWAKIRSSAGNHSLYDSARGAEKRLASSTTSAEATFANSLTSFDSDGFSLGVNPDGDVNNSSSTYVAWNWKAGGTAVANTDGTIASQVSANTKSGFSIVTYTGNGTAGATVGHGLNQPIDLYLMKNRSSAASWPAIGKALNDANPLPTVYMLLNATNAAASAAQGSGDSSTIELYSDATNNASGDDYVAYCFHSVEGFSKIGSYTGNGSADGPFIYTGFRPAYVMIKNATAADSWFINDNKRNSYNLVDSQLFANSSSAEADSRGLDFLSNGFKIRDNSTSHNGNGNALIYMAFAEQPFKYANAR